MPSYSELTQLTWMLVAGGGILAVSSMPMFTLVYLGTCTHCNLPKKSDFGVSFSLEFVTG